MRFPSRVAFGGGCFARVVSTAIERRRAVGGEIALLLLVASLAAPTGRAAAQEAFGSPEGFFPPTSCVTSVADTAVVSRVRVMAAAGLEAGAYSGERATPDALWTPGRIHDLIPFRDGYAVLDAFSRELLWVSDDLTTWETWARKGPGPGELGDPYALATSDADSGDLLVLQGRPFVVHRFGGDGEFGRTFRLDREADDVGVTGDGRIWLAYDVWLLNLSSGRAADAPLLRSTTADGREARTHWSATANNLDAPQFNVPGFVPARIAARGRFVAVYFPWSGIIELFDGGEHARTLETCMPDALRDAYRRQLRELGHGAPPPGRVVTSNMVTLLADVRIGDDGEVWALAGAPTEEGYLHIDRFDASGRNAGSIVFARPDSPFPDELRLGIDAERTVIEFNPRDGHIAVYDLSAGR